MSDLKRLTCLDCNFKSDNLVSHIERRCDKDSKRNESLLEAYMRNHGVDEKGVIFTVAPLNGNDNVVIGGISIPKGNGLGLIPKKNPAYKFGKNVSNVLMDIIENRRVMLVGHAGSGKTSLVEQIAALADQGVERVNFNGQTTVADFIGFWSVKNGETVWIDGALPRAAKNGFWLLCDEIDFGEPSILADLNPVLERDGKVVLKEKGGEVIVPHPNFRVFSTANTVGCMSKFRGLYQGTNIMNEAFLDRWRCYVIEYMSEAEESLVLTKTVPKISSQLAAPIIRVANDIRQAFFKEEVSCTFSTRRVIDWAELMVRLKDPMAAAEIAVFSKVSSEDAEVIKGIISRILGVRS